MAILGIDWGERRIGLAVSWSGHIAAAHSILTNEGLDQAAGRLLSICDELEIERIVLGVPAGSRHDADSIRERFEGIAGALRQKTCRPVVLWDESYSTTEAYARQRESGSRRCRRNAPVDALAAAVILQSWIDENAPKESC